MSSATGLRARGCMGRDVNVTALVVFDLILLRITLRKNSYLAVFVGYFDPILCLSNSKNMS